MKDIEFIISKQQAQEIAKFIFADIEAYVNSHPDEYVDYLKSIEEVCTDDISTAKKWQSSRPQKTILKGEIIMANRNQIDYKGLFDAFLI